MALWKIIKFLALVTIVVLGIELVSSEFNREWMILSWFQKKVIKCSANLT